LRPRRAIPKAEITVAQAKGQLLAFLYQCHASALKGVTLDELVQRYRVDRRTCEYELTIALQKRAEELK
jgi:hypothetical protein